MEWLFSMSTFSLDWPASSRGSNFYAKEKFQTVDCKFSHRLCNLRWVPRPIGFLPIKNVLSFQTHSIRSRAKEVCGMTADSWSISDSWGYVLVAPAQWIMITSHTLWLIIHQSNVIRTRQDCFNIKSTHFNFPTEVHSHLSLETDWEVQCAIETYTLVMHSWT